MILNEIIILNFFGLNENTYKTISERGQLDSTFGLNNGLDDTNSHSFANTENETEDE